MNKNIDYRQITDRDRYLDVKDMIIEILRKLWIAIIVAVIFAGLFGGYKYVEDSKDAQMVSEGEVTLADLEESMSAEDLNTVAYVYELQKNIQSQREYVGNSVYLSTDGMNQDRYTLQYACSDSQVAELLISYVENNGLVADVIKTGKVDMESRFLDELMFINYSSQQTANTNSQLEQDVDARVVSISVVERDAENCQELGQIVMDCVTNYFQTIHGIIPEASLNLLSASYDVVIDETVFAKTNNYATYIANSQTRLDNLTDTLSDQQKKLLAMYENEELHAEIGAQIDDGEDAAVEAPKVSINKKYLGLGAIGGFVLAIVVLILIYVFRGTVNTVQELQELYNVRILGLMKKKKDTESSDPKTNGALAMLLANLKSLHMNGEKVLLAGADAEETWVKALTTEMKDDFQLLTAADIQNAAAIETLYQVKYVILIETLKKSKHSKVAGDIKICMEQGAEILGVVAIR